MITSPEVAALVNESRKSRGLDPSVAEVEPMPRLELKAAHGFKRVVLCLEQAALVLANLEAIKAFLSANKK